MRAANIFFYTSSFIYVLAQYRVLQTVTLFRALSSTLHEAQTGYIQTKKREKESGRGGWQEELVKTPHPSAFPTLSVLLSPFVQSDSLKSFLGGWGGVLKVQCTPGQHFQAPNGERRETDCLSKNETFHDLHPSTSVSTLFASLAITVFTELNCLASPGMAGKRRRKVTTEKNGGGGGGGGGGGRRGLILLSQEEVARWRGKKNHARESQFFSRSFKISPFRLPKPSKEARDNALEGTDIKVLNRLFKSHKVQRDRVLELREERRKIKNR